MFVSAMDSIFAIGLGFALRFVVDAASHHNSRLGGSLVGLWEGAVLYHFLEKWPHSVDPYVGLVFRLFVDFLFTESVGRLAIVLLWTGMGFVLSDVTPAFWYDKNLHRFYRRTRRFVRHIDWSALKLPISTASISRVRFYQAPPPNTPVTPSAPTQSTPAASTSTQRRRSIPGNYPGYASSTDASTSAPPALRRPILATSLPPSAMRSTSRPKAPPSSSVSFEVIPPAAMIPSISDYLDAPDSRTPTPKPVPPPLAMPVPELIRSASGGPASSTLPPDNIDQLPEIIDSRDDPPPPFEATPGGFVHPDSKPPGAAWPREKLAVRNPAPSDGGSARSSVVEGATRSSIIVRADLLREQAYAEEKARDRLHEEQKRAFGEKRYADAVRYKVEQEEAHERAMSLHRRAAERYFKEPEERTIDVHRLKTREAIRRTEIGIRDALTAGDTRLRVICGRGNHSPGKIPALKLALITAMSQNRIETEVDPTNPGVIHIKLPVA
ncbi:hypothetical protein BC834DRAFT_110448 [Gloeopeniophorella convolvens]|nr:hypothetical protein BC834DRAFT_110448 [Gloeopeniophorella convolvens]